METELIESKQPVLLVLRALKLGDLLVAVPALRGLRRGFPGHHIVLAAPGWLAPIVTLIDAIDELLPVTGLDEPLPLAPGEVDIAVNLHGSGTESATRVRELAARSTIEHSPKLPWIADLHERDRWVRLVTAHGAPANATDVSIARPSVAALAPRATVVHVGAFYGSREWPAERFAAVARELYRRGHNVVLTGSGAERPRTLHVAALAGLAETHVLAGRASLDEFAAVIAEARLMVTVDTGAAHLASAYATPSVVLFGPAPPSLWGPPHGPHVVVTHEELRKGETFADEPDPALLAVTVDEVLDEIALLERLELSFERVKQHSQ